MSTLENCESSKVDISKLGVQKMIDKNVPIVATSNCNNGHIKSCSGNKNEEQLHAAVDGDLEDASPDISLSSQKTLRYCDVESETHEAGSSLESSDSVEHLKEDLLTEVDQSFIRKLSLTQTLKKNSTKPLDKQKSKQNYESSSDISGKIHADNQTEQTSSVSLADHHEGIPECNNVSRPESLSLSCSRQDVEQEHASASFKSKKHAVSKRHNEPNMRVQSLSEADHLESLQDDDVSHVESNICLPKNLPQGTITRKGDMIQFVADDLVEKIKKSSPMSHADTSSNGSRRSSVRSIASASSSTSFATSSGVSRSPSSLCQQSPDDIPPIDALAVIDLENHARRVADSLDLMMGNIRNSLHKMSAITIGCQDAYKRSVDITCDSVDASIKSMYALMAKCEELNSSMKPVDHLTVQIKEIKRILDLFEAQMTDK
ncbi:unnamed protein product [Candidula unifasciata]|uniref:BLOC-1-related complex subunit 6 C-terminal helix domain-containing protein n=1 Tax=Candidula unifasciata TaxID=100452 RepID=A0A8S3YM17_9EUPU|nr:unnamed protein product [Candidula unifasciata]